MTPSRYSPPPPQAVPQQDAAALLAAPHRASQAAPPTPACGPLGLPCPAPFLRRPPRPSAVPPAPPASPPFDCAECGRRPPIAHSHSLERLQAASEAFAPRALSAPSLSRAPRSARPSFESYQNRFYHATTVQRPAVCELHRAHPA